MDRIEFYAAIIRRLLDEYVEMLPPEEGLEIERIYDNTRHHYELLYLGWEKLRRVHGCILHLDIRDGKIWIQHDGTEDGIALRLMEEGVPRDQIVLAFHPPYKRPDTGFAAA